jgi:hypothetical protein
VTSVMSDSQSDLEDVHFGHLLLLAMRLTGVTRSQIATACSVNSRTVARWENAENDPPLPAKTHAIEALQQSGKLDPKLLALLTNNVGLEPWSLGYGTPPVPVFTPSAATRKVLDDAVREAAEELGIATGVLRPALSKLLRALVEYEIPPGAAAEMVVERSRR